MRFRHYDPVWGRWTSRDPAGYQDSMSLYGYGWGSPLGGADPFGLVWWNPWTWGDEDREWEEMMRENQEFLRRKLESQRDRGIISDEQYAQEVWAMRNMLETVMMQLALIEANAKVAVLETARNILIAMIPIEGGFVLIYKFARPVVIGAKMGRVALHAEKLGAAIYKGRVAEKLGLLMKALGFSQKQIDEMYMVFNWIWIQWQKANGRQIIDVGYGQVRGARPFYEMERRATQNYWRLESCPLP